MRRDGPGRGIVAREILLLPKGIEMPSTVSAASCQNDAHGEGNGRADPLARLHDLFARTAGQFPNRVAVLCRGREWTYQELDFASNRLARLLRARGVGRGDCVGLFLPRGAEVYVALLAILKAGAAYVPLDPDYPPDRVAYILDDCQARALVTTADLSIALTSFSGSVVPLDVLSTTAALEAESDAPLADESARATADDICYVIYTSGSTGRPKGVQIEHRSACHLVQAEWAIFQVGPDDRVYQGFSIAFDASV
jgi:non-ribosomal peptide synthetase component F